MFFELHVMQMTIFSKFLPDFAEIFGFDGRMNDWTGETQNNGLLDHERCS